MNSFESSLSDHSFGPEGSFAYWQERAERGDQVTDDPEEGINASSDGDEAVDYSELIEQSAFLGEYPYSTIEEGIQEQFANYIGTEDKTDYVDIFYTQLHNSFDSVESDVEEEHPVEIKEVLNKISDKFNSMMFRLFEQRLTITILGIDDEEADQEDIEFIIRTLYEYFILNARQNFKTVISKDIAAKIGTIIEDDNQYYTVIRRMLQQYSPFVRAIGPMEFIRYTGNDEVRALFDDGKVAGNFLRKYSPRLYQFEDFEVEIVAHITMVQQVKGEILNAAANSK